MNPTLRTTPTATACTACREETRIVFALGDREWCATCAESHVATVELAKEGMTCWCWCCDATIPAMPCPRCLGTQWVKGEACFDCDANGLYVATIDEIPACDDCRIDCWVCDGMGSLVGEGDSDVPCNGCKAGEFPQDAGRFYNMIVAMGGSF